jgi:RimJ/RimL family protein N-acetyltransferase
MTRSGSRWLAESPVEQIDGRGICLRRSDRGDSDELIVAVNRSLEHLRPWMPWAQQTATPQSIGAFLEQAVLDWDAGLEFQFAIRSVRDRQPDRLIGFCGLHDRVGAGILEIGYWVHVDHIGRGVGTAAAEALTRSALALGEVDRVEIHCDAANLPSAAIPARLGFRLDRIEGRNPQTPAETGRHMIWVLDATPGPAPVVHPRAAP